MNNMSSHDVAICVKKHADKTGDLKGAFEKYSKKSGILIGTLKKAFYKAFPADEHPRNCLLTIEQELALIYAI